MSSNLFEKHYDFEVYAPLRSVLNGQALPVQHPVKHAKSVQWTVFGYILTRRARQYPGTSSAFARIVSASELREFVIRGTTKW